MLTEDYLMRMLRLAVAAIAKALGLKAMELYTDALYVLNQGLEGLLGLRVDLLNPMDDSSIYAHLTGPNGLDTERLLVAADIYREQADIYARVNEPVESRWRFLRALNFYIEASLNGVPDDVPAPDEKIDMVVSALGLVSLPTETLYALAGLWEDSGRLAQASSAMEHMQHGLGDAPEARAEVQDFYRRLLEKSDAELEAGGLTRAQITDRMAQG